MKLIDIINNALQDIGLVGFIDVPVNPVIKDDQGNPIQPKVVGRMYYAYPISKSEAYGARIDLAVLNLFVRNTYNGALLSRHKQFSILYECESRLYALNMGFESRYNGIDSLTQDARLDMEIQILNKNI